MTLTLTNVQAAQAGTYTVVVSNLVSVATASATLALGAAPVIAIQPASHTAACGATASLTVERPARRRRRINGFSMGRGLTAGDRRCS